MHHRLDYTEQTSWILFLNYLDDLEQERALASELVSKPYSFIIHKQHRWSKWAAHGNFDHDKALTGDEDRRRSDGLQSADHKSRRFAFVLGDTHTILHEDIDDIEKRERKG